jgi:predicted kinase
MIPRLTCYHATILIFFLQVTKMLGQICKYSQDMSLQFLEFSKPNSKCAKRNKKINCYVNSVILSFLTVFMLSLSFCFS